MKLAYTGYQSIAVTHIRTSPYFSELPVTQFVFQFNIFAIDFALLELNWFWLFRTGFEQSVAQAIGIYCKRKQNWNK
jgi:ABC-type uncharacterized transport system permease subunit